MPDTDHSNEDVPCPAASQGSGSNTRMCLTRRIRTGIYIDAENATWLNEARLATLLNRVRSRGPTGPLRAVGNVLRLGEKSVRRLDEAGFDITQVTSPQKRKNGADIELTIQVLEDLKHHPWMRRVVIASGDTDFAPLFRHLAKQGIEAICVSPQGPLSEAVRSRCKHHWTPSDLTPAPPPPATPPPQCEASEAEQSELRAALQSILAAAEGDLHLSHVGLALRSKILGFDHKRFGPNQLWKLLRLHPDLVRLVEIERNGQKVKAARRPT